MVGRISSVTFTEARRRPEGGGSAAVQTGSACDGIGGGRGEDGNEGERCGLSVDIDTRVRE